MTHAWTHAWCKSPARDEAVRAAEDNRTKPLPTLKECIAAPFAEAAERSVPVSKTGEGQSGMRTERITLEVKHGEPYGVSHWSWVTILRLQSGKSVRVVEEAHFDDLAQVAMERDAAIRERDELRKSWLRSEESGTRLLAERNAALDDADGLRKRVAELEAASGGGEKKPMRMPSREWFARMADVDEANISVGGLASRVAEVEAASGAEQEPVAWGATRDSGSIADAGTSRREMEHVSGMMGGTVVPLYRSPPQPRGWLTGEEREAVETARDHFDNDDLGDSECVFIARMMKQILARSTPPEVVLPENPYHPSGLREGFEHALRAVRNELVNAGVGVKEVGSE